MRGCILAGGRSSRFGRDKALYLVQGQAMALHIAQVMRRVGLEPVLVGRCPRKLDLPELFDEEEGELRHPLFGVATGLREGAALFSPCDLPDLKEESLQALLEAFRIHPQGVYARGQPLLGIFPASLREKALEMARNGGRVRDFVLNLTEVECGVLKNLNSPEADAP